MQEMNLKEFGHMLHPSHQSVAQYVLQDSKWTPTQMLLTPSNVDDDENSSEHLDQETAVDFSQVAYNSLISSPLYSPVMVVSPVHCLSVD